MDLEEEFLEIEEIKEPIIKKQDFDKKIEVNIFNKKLPIKELIYGEDENKINFKDNSLDKDFIDKDTNSHFKLKLKKKKEPELDASEKKGEIIKDNNGCYWISMKLKNNYRWILIKQNK